MATITPTKTKLNVVPNGSAWRIQWANMANGDTGAPVSLTNFFDRSVQVTGTFGAGGTVVLEGTNDGTNYSTLNNPADTALSLQAAAIEQVTEITEMVRPDVTAGDGTTDLTVTMVVSSHGQGGGL